MLLSQATRRAFLTSLFAGSAVAIVGVAATGCAAPMGAAGAEGPVEVVPMRDGLWYANTLPKTIPAVRFSPAVAPQFETSKASE